MVACSLLLSSHLLSHLLFTGYMNCVSQVTFANATLFDDNGSMFLREGSIINCYGRAAISASCLLEDGFFPSGGCELASGML